MNSKEVLIKDVIQQFLRTAMKYARIEKLPVPVEEGIEVTTKEAHTIQAIGEGTQMSVTEVANRFGVTKSAASQIVTRLEKKGFVKKAHVPDNNKEWNLALTRLGWQVFHAHEHLHGKDLTDLVNRLEAFSAQEIEAFSVLLKTIDGVMDSRLGEN